MHRVRATLIVAVLVAASLLLAGPVQAGGPTSALLSVPGGGRTASLYYTDAEYDALSDLVGITSDAGTGTVDESGRSHASGPSVTVTWLIHDVLPWRVDSVYLGGAGAPWIATQMSDDSGAIWDSEVVWHQPASPGELVELLDKLGVGVAAPPPGDVVEGTADSSVPAAAEPAAATPQAATPDPAPADPSPLAAAWWALGGVTVGVGLTLLWAARRGRNAGDASADTGDEPADAPDLVGAEKLSWP